LKQGKAYDDRKNPISHKERWGFVFVSIPIRNHSTGYRSYIDKLMSGIKDKIIPEISLSYLFVFKIDTCKVSLIYDSYLFIR